MMTYKEHFKKNISLAFPVMLSQLGHVLVGVADSVMVGRLGTAELAAVSLSGAPFFLVMLFGIGVSYGITPLIAAADGEGSKGKIREYLSHAIVLNTILGVLMFVFIFYSAPALQYFGQDPEVLRFALPFLNICAASLIPIMIFQSYRQFAEGLSHTKQAMYISISTNILNVLLNYLLIYGVAGFPELGMNGAAWATLISRVVMAIAMILFVYRYHRFAEYMQHLDFKNLKFSVWNRILRVGVPSGLQFVFEVGAFATAAIMVGWISAEALAAHQIALNLAGITYMTASGISAAATIRVGNQLGRNDIPTLRRAGFTCFIMASTFMAVCGIIFILANRFLPSLYIDELPVIDIASKLLIIAAFFQISDGVQVVGLGALRGLSDTKVPTFVTLISFWIISIPLAYVLGFPLGFGVQGIWVGLLVGLTLAASAHVYRFNQLTKKLRAMVVSK